MNYLALTGQDLQSIESGLGPTYKFQGKAIGTVINVALPYFFAIAGFALTIYIVLAGFTILTSKGDEKAVAAAKAKLTSGVTGFFIVFAAYWIVQIVGNVLGLDKINAIFQ
jgi:hypothetical protein